MNFNFDDQKYESKDGLFTPVSTKNYNILRAFNNYWTNFKGDNMVKSFKKKYGAKKQKKANEQIRSLISDEYTEDQIKSFGGDFDKIKKDFLEKHPELGSMDDETLSDLFLWGLSSGGAVFFEKLKGLGVKAGKLVGQKIGEFGSKIPVVGQKLSGALENYGFFDSKKVSKDPISLIHENRSDKIFNLHSLDEKPAIGEFLKNTFMATVVGPYMKTFGSAAVGGFFVMIMGPVGMIPGLALTIIGTESSVNSIVKVPEDLLLEIMRFVKHGFDQGRDIKNIEIEISDDDFLDVRDDKKVSLGKLDLSKSPEYISFKNNVENFAKEAQSLQNSSNKTQEKIFDAEKYAKKFVEAFSAKNTSEIQAQNNQSKFNNTKEEKLTMKSLKGEKQDYPDNINESNKKRSHSENESIKKLDNKNKENSPTKK
jgi:hypothetical protein